ncbi:MAG: hypothetical protein JO222_09260 [Frankiales bacterium]|nr:hypothetical protein [Frankiales bacterium]
MADYRALAVDAATGLAHAEVPLTISSFSYCLNNIGQLTGSFPADAYFAAEDVFQGSVVELSVLRDDVPVWNGPITNLDGSRRGGWSLTAREASWWLTKRTIEEDKVYVSEDIFDIVRDLVDYMTSKVSTAGDGYASPGTDLLAALPRFFVTAGLAGVAKSYSFYGSARHKIDEAFENALVADPDTGLDWRMDYGPGAHRQTCDRTLTLGSPSLGETHDLELREHLLYDYGRVLDWERSANRAHGTDGSGKVVTKQNTGSTDSGFALLEDVFDFSGSGAADVDLVQMTKDARRMSNPPLHDRWVEFVPGVTLPFGWCACGDVVKFDIQGPGLLQITAQHKRVVQTDVTPAAGGEPERVKLTMGIPLDDLGT